MMNSLASTLIDPPFVVAILFAAAFAGLAWLAGWLTRGGALSTFVVGCVIFGLGGGRATVPLLAFFLTSSLLSRWGRGRKAQAEAHSAKGARRDAGQVWANGGMAVGLVLAHSLIARYWPQPLYKTHYFSMLFLAALATVNADTWATEVGGLSRRAPRLLTNWRAVAPGTSGAITGLGLLASLLGSVVIPLSVLWLWHLDASEFVSIAWAGFLGSLADSLLGAGIQAQYRDPISGDLTDRAGQKAIPARGIAWVTNDVVNFLASVVGVLFAWAMLYFGAYAVH
jgi:uncharacterized protein (TIGR00297 family)